MDFSDLEFPKPGDLEQPAPWHTIYPDGREVLNLLTAEGRAEKERRIDIAWDVQDGDCAICGMPLKRSEATWDHIEPRGMGGGRRDDRQHNIAAVHGRCNSEKGSQRRGYSRR